MAKACVFYVVNRGYLFSTVLSAIQARQNLSPNIADVFIFHIGPPHRESEIAADVCQAEHINLVHIDPAVTGHIPIHYARLVFDRFVPPEYRQVLYLDGDTQIVASLDPLVRAQPGPGGIMAVRDPLAILQHSQDPAGVAARAYFQSLGLRRTDYGKYVNSGVLRIDREGWADTAAKCLARYRETPGTFRFCDQDILNLVAGERITIASFRWNFPAFYLVHRIDALVQPAIVHFMSNPRPWFGPLPAFGRRWHRPYLDLIQKYPEFAAFRPRPPLRKYIKYILQQYVVAFRNQKFWESELASRAIMDAEASVEASNVTSRDRHPIKEISNQAAPLLHMH